MLDLLDMLFAFKAFGVGDSENKLVFGNVFLGGKVPPVRQMGCIMHFHKAPRVFDWVVVGVAEKVSALSAACHDR